MTAGKPATGAESSAGERNDFERGSDTKNRATAHPDSK
jgi:hypothetical protein